MDDFKRNIKGFRGKRVNPTGAIPGQTCPCCRETDKKSSRKLARRRLKQQDRAVAQERRGGAGEG